jgi:chaperone required for assembly of F1-ATPase
MSAQGQRFYREVSVNADGDSYAVLLDGKPLSTPARKPLVLPNLKLAEAVADEWRAQTGKIQPANMLLTKLANTAIDRVAPERSEAIRQIVAFGQSDLLCYRAESPSDLVERQNRLWNPLLDWGRETYGVDLQCGAGLSHVPQASSLAAALELALSGQADLTLAAVHAAATLTGSAIIALALAAGRISAADAFSAAQLDETYQAERWGRDEEAEQRSRKALDEITKIDRFFELLRRR